MERKAVFAKSDKKDTLNVFSTSESDGRKTLSIILKSDGSDRFSKDTNICILHQPERKLHFVNLKYKCNGCLKSCRH